MVTLLILALAWAAQGSPAVAASPDPPPREAVELRGRAVCVDAAGHRQACGRDPERFALESADGALHPFAPEDVLAAIFKDARVRDRDLAIRARPRADGVLEIVKVYSVKQGKLHDVHYYCEVCAITAYAPGPCPCCRREMELRETPLP
jgi:hypothetical protein